MVRYCSIILFFFIGISCGWSQSALPLIEATGDQLYCPMSQLPIATDFKIDATNTTITELFIQISSGYMADHEELFLKGSHPKIRTSWNRNEGKLTLSSVVSGDPMDDDDLVQAVRDVVFESTSMTSSGERFFSFSIGNANYLPSTGHYYEFVPAIGITWQDAKLAASQRDYYGLQGYLATIGSAEESQLAGEQSSGAGWIGGTDEDVEGIWKWATGPEAGTIFWNGGPNGASPAGQYANWNTGEPNDLSGEDYAHITAPGEGIKGSWNDLSNTGAQSGNYQPKGYIVEYGGMPGDPDIDISTSTKITVNPIQSVKLPETVPDYEACDSDTNGFTEFDLTSYVPILLNGTSAADYNFKFFTDANYTNLIANPSNFINTVSDEQSIYVRIFNNLDDQCDIKASFMVKVIPLPNVPLVVHYRNCDADEVMDGYTDFSLREIDAKFNPSMSSEFKISYHLTEDQAKQNKEDLSDEPFNNATQPIIYARIENANQCFTMATVHLEVSTTSFPDSYLEELMVCDEDGDNDGYHVFDLEATKASFLTSFPAAQQLTVHFYENQTDAQLNQNEIQNTSNYTNSTAFSQYIYVRVQSGTNGDCYGVGPHLKLTVNPLPEFEVEQSAGLCNNGDPIILEAFGTNGQHSYIWKDANNQIVSTQPTATIGNAGIYSIQATSNAGCESLALLYEVKASSIATLTESSVSIDDLSNRNTVTIDTLSLGIGDYEFSLKNRYGPFQEDQVFKYVAIGKHTLYVRDRNGCGTAELDVYVMGFPKYFTPNNDGHNDTWNIEGFQSQFSSKSYIDIYDRYGSIMGRILPHHQGWDGTIKGEPAPASDYWYVAHFIEDSGNVRNYKGNFSLIR